MGYYYAKINNWNSHVPRTGLTESASQMAYINVSGNWGGEYLNSQIEQADLSEKYYLKSLEIMSSPHLGPAPLTYYRSFICQPTEPSAHPWLGAEDFGESCSSSIR